jgi:hypothetical protein
MPLVADTSWEVKLALLAGKFTFDAWWLSKQV